MAAHSANLSSRDTNSGSYPQAGLCSVFTWADSTKLCCCRHLLLCCCCCLRYQPGDQVFLCYGRHTNLELLEVYGFMLADNPHDVALLPPDTLVHHLQEAACRFQQQQQQSGVPGRRAHCRRPQKHHEQQHTATLGGAVKCRHVLDVSSVDCWVHANGQPSWQLLCALR
jgi:hypothetical protein